MSFAIIIPIYNNYQTLVETIKSVIHTINEYDYHFTIILIDDGSTDNSSELLSQQKDSRIRIFRLDKNYGQMTAIYAGLKTSDANYTIILSADLQEEKELLRKFIESSINNPYADLIIGVRQKNSDYFIFKLLSKLFYKIIKLKIPNMPEGGFDTVCLGNSLKQKFISNYYSTIFGQAVLLELSELTIHIPYHRQKSKTQKVYLKSILFKVWYFYNGLKYVYFGKYKRMDLNKTNYHIKELTK
jgi:glycosyltransferase involved in cell wall biosynthesis